MTYTDSDDSERKVKLDGSQWPRLKNMRAKPEKQEAEKDAVNLLDKLHNNGQVLFDRRDSGRRAVSHWFMKGQSKYECEAEDPTNAPEIGSIQREWIQRAANSTKSYTLACAEDYWDSQATKRDFVRDKGAWFSTEDPEKDS